MNECVCGWGGGLKKTESQSRKVSLAPASKAGNQEKLQSREAASTWRDADDLYSSSLTIKCDLSHPGCGDGEQHRNFRFKAKSSFLILMNHVRPDRRDSAH